MKIVRQLEDSVWREYVERSPLGNIFHTPEMYEVFARTKGYRPSVWATVAENGEPLALLPPVQIDLMGGPMRLLTSRAVVYGSVLCNPDEQGQEALAFLLNGYRREARRSHLFTELRNQANLAAIQPVLQESRFIYEDHLDYLIDLEQPQDAIWQKINSRIRKKIRRAQKQEAQYIQEVNTPELLRESYEVVRKSYTRARIPLADFSLFQAIFDILCPRKMAYIATAYFQGAPICSTISLLYKGVALGFYCGMDRQYSDHSPTEYLWWHDIEWSIANGYSVFDFGGAGRPNEEYGVREFKARFGGDLVNYGRNVCVHTPRLLNLSKRGYQLYRRFLSMLSTLRIGVSGQPRNVDAGANKTGLLAIEDQP